MRNRWAARTMVGIGAAMWLASRRLRERDEQRRLGDAPIRQTRRGAILAARFPGSHQFSTTSDWPKSAFSGLDFSRSGMQEARFAVTRDAGKFDFEGVLRDGAGAGSFQFLSRMLATCRK